MNTQPSFQQIYERLRGRIREYVSYKIPDQDYVDDLVQEIFIKVHNNIGELDDRDKLDRWIFRIARNRVTDYYRTRRQPAPLESGEPEAPKQLLSEYDRVFDTDIRDWINELPEQYRQVLLLTELQQKKYAEVARELNLSEAAVKSRVLRGREKLKQMLLECCHFEFDRRGGIADCVPKKYCPECVTIGLHEE